MTKRPAIILRLGPTYEGKFRAICAKNQRGLTGQIKFWIDQEIMENKFKIHPPQSGVGLVVDATEEMRARELAAKEAEQGHGLRKKSPHLRGNKG